MSVHQKLIIPQSSPPLHFLLNKATYKTTLALFINLIARLTCFTVSNPGNNIKELNNYRACKVSLLLVKLPQHEPTIKLQIFFSQTSAELHVAIEGKSSKKGSSKDSHTHQAQLNQHGGNLTMGRQTIIVVKKRGEGFFLTFVTWPLTCSSTATNGSNFRIPHLASEIECVVLYTWLQLSG